MKLLLLNFITISIIILQIQGCQTLLTPHLFFKKILCEYASEPIGLDTISPRFSWILESSQRGRYQTAYQIQVASSKKKLEENLSDMWDSGKIPTGQTLHHPYHGIPLKSNHTYYWKITVWDNLGNRILCDPRKFSTGLLRQDDWKAKWIGAGPLNEPRNEKGFFKNIQEQYTYDDTIVHDGRSILLRNEFTFPKKIKSARIFITGLGYYELMINGKKVGNHVLASAKTNYRNQILYDTYEVSKYLQQGKNGIGIHLGNGWFNPYKKWWQEYRMQWFGAKRAILQMHVDYQDGTSTVFVSDENWKYNLGPILFNCIYDGEVYNANMECDGWSESNFDDSNWQEVHVVEPPGGKMISHQMPAIKVNQIIKPINKMQPKPGMLVYDLGQNFAGWIRIVMKGPKGTKLNIRFAEDLNEDKTIDITSNEKAKATAAYILKGVETETYEPRFTFFGFRYLELTADPELPSIENLEGCVVHSANESVGRFECGNNLINKIHRATVWSQKSNMLGYPLDCPQRDERLGWFGDAQVTAEEAMFNFNMSLFYKNWLSGIKTNQNEKTGDIPIISPRPYIWDEGVEWSSTYILLTWQYYLYYGDKQILLEHYDSMKRYLDFLNNLSKNYILQKGWIGDWGSLVEGWQEGEPESIPTAFYYFNTITLAKIAQIIDKNNYSTYYISLAQKIKKAYNDKYFNLLTKNYNDGSQMANAFPLFLDMVPNEYKADVLENLVQDILFTHNGHLTTGVLGSKYMIDALTKEGRNDVAWLLATQTGFPSWSNMVEKYTTLCEFWTLKQSHNHVMMGSIDAWFYKTLAGINLDEKYPAYKNIIIRPYFADNLTFAQASIETLRGTVSSKWEINETRLKMKIRVPFNTTADVYIPIGKNSRVFEGGIPIEEVKDITDQGYMNNYKIYSVVSGNYEFTVTR